MSNVLKMLSRGGAAAADTDPNFKQTVLLLHGDGTNGAQNNTFLDGSTNNFTITRNGNTTQGTFSPFSLAEGEWSNYFTGDDSSIRFASTASYGIGTGNFTVELWANFSSLKTGTGHNRLYAQSVSGTDGIVIDYFNDGIQVGIQNTYPINVYSWTPTIGRWYHIAVVRSGTGTNQVALYIDGVSVATGTSSASVVANNINIGSIEWATNWGFNGYISNVRFSNTARTITVPTGPYVDDADTLLLTCQSNRFVDNATPANTTVSTFATAPRVTPFSPFAPTAAYSAGTNGGSGYFDGTGDYLTVADNAAFDLSGDFTIEFVAYATGANNRRFLQLGDYRAGNNGLVIYSNASNALVVYVNGATIITGSAFPLNQWVYVALVRSGGGSNNLKLYMNAVQDGQATNTVSFTGVAGNGVAIGAEYGGSYAATAECYISTVRIVNGTALTPAIPTAPLTNITNTSLLLNFTNAGIIDNTGKNNLETVGNAQIDTAVKKYGTGSLEFDGTGDYLIGAGNSTELQFGTGNFTVEFWVYPNVVNTTQYLIDFRDPASATSAGFQWFIENTAKLGLYVGNTAVIAASTGSISASTWTHLALVKNGSTWTIYINGTADATTGTNTTSLTQGFLTVGTSSGNRNTTTTAKLNGYIDDLRITKGVARYTANFTAPTKEFPDL